MNETEATAIEAYASGEALVRVGARLIGYVEPAGDGRSVVHPFAVPSRTVPAFAAGIRLLRLLALVTASGGDVDAVIVGAIRLRDEPTGHRRRQRHPLAPVED